ncbi:MAG: riboflavin synthase [Myxococcaceae bacterium]
MFTGLVQDLGTVVGVSPGPTLDLWIQTQLPTREFRQGESIAVHGPCLTVVEISSDRFRVQLGPETLRCTTLGSLKVGAQVHLERALSLSDRLGGHFVLGHVDAMAKVRVSQADGAAWRLDVELPQALSPLFIEKGSVALDGVSLTVNSLARDTFSVTLIPETLTRTTLGRTKVGDTLNIETDVLGKYVLRQSQQRPVSTLTIDSVLAKGFA